MIKGGFESHLKNVLENVLFFTFSVAFSTRDVANWVVIKNY